MEVTVDGLGAYVYSGGKSLAAAQDNALPALLFIHGAALDHSCWNLQSRWFAHHGHGVFAVDLPGHGRSAGAPLTSIAAMAAWLVAFLDAAGIERAALVGHSMGSLAAQAAAACFPERITSIALLGNATPMPVSAALLEAAKNDEPRARNMINVWSHSPRAHLGGNAVPGLWLPGMNLRLMERAAPGVLFADLSACNDYRDGLAQAAKVVCPALILSGSHDLMAPPKATLALAAALPGAKRQVLNGAGHAMMSEQPDAVLDALFAFLAGA